MCFTCSIRATRLRVFENTSLTSRDTVVGEGMYNPGLPVFIRHRNPRSATILKGRTLSAIQRTISALGHGMLVVRKPLEDG